MNPSPETVGGRHRAAGELGAVLATGGLFLVFENVLHLKLPFLVAALVGWGAYIAIRLRAEPRAAWTWGLWRRESIGAAVRLNIAIIAAGVLILGGYRWAAGWTPLPPSALLLLALYPVWGLLQQFVLQSLGTTNLERLGLPSWSIVPASSLIFAAAHLPDWRLALMCGVAGALFTAAFRRTRNLLPLAVAHAWLGTLAYCWILERNPWLELVPKVLDATPKGG